MHLKTLVAIIVCLTARTATDDCFRAAVYEHFRAGNQSTDEPSVIVEKNLDIFEDIAIIAAKEV